MLRRLRTKLRTAVTSFTASGVRDTGGLFCAGSSIAFGRVERP